MGKLIDEFRRGWQGTSRPSPLFSIVFAAVCIAFVDDGTVVSFFDPAGYILYPVFSGRVVCHRVRRFPDRDRDRACGRVVRHDPEFWRRPDRFRKAGAVVDLSDRYAASRFGAIEHYRSVASNQREIARRLIQEEEYRKLMVDELQHRLKNKLSTIHAVLHQVLQDQPQIWASIDQRMRALSATDDLIARVDGSGCDIKDLLLVRTRALRPCPLYPERRSAVSARQAGGEPCVDIS